MNNTMNIHDVCANLSAQPLGRAHLVSLHAISHCESGDEPRERARQRYHTLSADQQRTHAAYVLTYPQTHPVDHLQTVIVGGRPC